LSASILLRVSDDPLITILQGWYRFKFTLAKVEDRIDSDTKFSTQPYSASFQNNGTFVKRIDLYDAIVRPERQGDCCALSQFF